VSVYSIKQYTKQQEISLPIPPSLQEKAKIPIVMENSFMNFWEKSLS
jgi:hypothetical protein